MSTEPAESRVEDESVTASGVSPSDVQPAVADPTADQEPSVEVVKLPSRTTMVITILAALVGVVTTAPFALLAIPFGFVGLILVAGGIAYAYSRAWLTVGIAMTLVGALLSGGYGAIPVELMILGIGATLVSWDVGQYGISVGNQLGRQARTHRLEIVHAATTTIVLGIFGLFAYAVYLLGSPGQPAGAVALALIGVMFLLWTFRT